MNTNNSAPTVLPHQIQSGKSIITYLLHFTEPVRHCQHYIGSTTADCFDRRMAAHANGTGANLTHHVFYAAVGMVLARTWQTENRQLEKALKKRGHFKMACPICNPKLQAQGFAPIKRLRTPYRCRDDWTPAQWAHLRFRQQKTGRTT